MTLLRLLSLVCLIVLVSACGGSGDEGAASSRTLSDAAMSRARVTSAPVTPRPSETPPILVIEPRVTEGPREAPDEPEPTETSELVPTLTAIAQALALGTVPVLEPPTEEPEDTPRPGETAKPTKTRRSSAGGDSSSKPTRTPRPGDPTDTPTPKPTVPTNTPAPTEDNSTLGKLRRGGLVIYLRHARTDWDQNDRELAWVDELLATGDSGLFDQCDRQRLLSGEGKDQARAIGETIRGLGIPVGRVMTSKWCRTRETAELAFGGGEAKGDQLFDTGYLDSSSDDRKHFKNALRQMLSASPGGGSNTFIVGHGPQIYDATGISLEEGYAAIFEPDSDGDGYKTLEKRVSPDAWAGLD